MFWQCWGGCFDRLPEILGFPTKCSVSDIIQHYYCNDHVHKVVALRKLKSSDVQHIKRGKAYLSNVRFLMKVLVQMAEEEGMTIGNDELVGSQLTRFVHTVSPKVFTLNRQSKRACTISWEKYVKKSHALHLGA